MAATTVNDLLDGRVSLDVECLDRIYLNGYVPNFQVGGQVVSFMTAHLGFPIPSPAILEKMGTAFRRSVSAFVQAERVPVVHFKKDDRKIEVMGRHIAAQAATGRSGSRRSGWRRNTRTCSPRTIGRLPTGSHGSPSPRLIGG